MRVAIVGGGTTGAAAAITLKDEPGIKVQVFDQGGRGPGGRASHRRVDARSASHTVLPDDKHLEPLDTRTFEFDHGCQFFRADSSEMRALAAQWCESGWAAPWTGRFSRVVGPKIDDSPAAPDFFGLPGSEAPVFVGIGGMQQLPRALLANSGAAVERGTRVCSIARTESGAWALRGTRGLGALHDTSNAVAQQTADASLGEFDVVLLTDASSSLGGWHRASANLSTGGPTTSEADAAAADAAVARVRSRVRVPLFTALVTLSQPIGDPDGVPLDAFSVVGGGSPLWFAARSQSKPGIPRGGAECWTLVSTPHYAVGQIEATPMQEPTTGAFLPQEEVSIRAQSISLF